MRRQLVLNALVLGAALAHGPAGPGLTSPTEPMRTPGDEQPHGHAGSSTGSTSNLVPKRKKKRKHQLAKAARRRNR